MPIALPSNLLPRNATNPDPALRGTYFLMEDIYLKGGYQIRETHQDRDEINVLNRKSGMWVRTQSDGVIWELQDDLVSWQPVSFGSSGGPGLGKRKIYRYTTPVLQQNEYHDVTVFEDLSTALVLRLFVDVPCVVEIHSTAQRNDSNPYRFIATAEKLEDDGISQLEEASVIKHRRFSIIANLEDPPALGMFCRIFGTELSSVVELTALALPLESLS